ncbi:MAG: phosphoribosyl-ATP diphosphatase [Pseudorhodoplanes sp.]|uniref:phosphoribosyl-ATP diphosphatase n=1 Tax=Pseudorhodoplanes sp. TaxID=1934341 RepID=UPI003D0E9984
MSDSIERLHKSVVALQKGDPQVSRTARLIRSGRAKIAKKMAEEAVEVVVDVMRGNREAAVRESADLLYHLVVLWAEAGIRPQDVWAEMDRRERLLGLAEKPPKDLPLEPVPTAVPVRRKVVALEARRIPKRRRSGY